MTEARELVGSDRSTLFLIDKSGDTPMLWAKVIDGMAAIRLPVGVGIVGMSARSEEIINIPDAYKDDRFNSGFDKKTGYKTNTILCIPVWKGDEMIGVLQLINKLHGVFNDDDIDIMKDFCSFISSNCLRDDIPIRELSTLQSSVNEWKRNRKEQATSKSRYFLYLKTLMTEA